MDSLCREALREARLRAVVAEDDAERLRVRADGTDALSRLKQVHAYLAHRSGQWHQQMGHAGCWLDCTEFPCVNDLAELDATSPELETTHAD